MNKQVNPISTRAITTYDRLLQLELRRHTACLSSLHDDHEIRIERFMHGRKQAEILSMKKKLLALEGDFLYLQLQNLNFEVCVASPFLDGTKVKVDLQTNSFEEQTKICHHLARRGFEESKGWEEVRVFERNDANIYVTFKNK